MSEFISTFVFILPGIMAYFWLQLFGLNPSVKHTAPELSGIAALLWLPVSFITLLLLNIWASVVNIKILSVQSVWTVKELNSAASDLKYLVLFISLSFIVSFFLCWIWSLWGIEILQICINKVRDSRNLAPLSSSASVWEEVFIKIDEGEKEKEAVFVVYKIDKPEDFIAGSMTKASRPLEADKSLVLENTELWMDSIKNDYNYEVKRIYIDTKSGMVVKEIDHKNPKEKTIPENSII